MNPDRPQARIAEKNLQTGTRSRVALQHRVNVFADVGDQKHGDKNLIWIGFKEALNKFGNASIPSGAKARVDTAVLCTG
jgi:hypothetical protein